MRLTDDECRTRLGAARVAVLGTLSPGNQPHLVPIVFALMGTTIATAVDEKPKVTRELRRLRNVAANEQVSILAQHYSDDWSALWWVRADGRARVVTANDDHRDALAALAAKYPQYRDHLPSGPVILVTVDRLTGWATG